MKLCLTVFLRLSLKHHAGCNKARYACSCLQRWEEHLAEHSECNWRTLCKRKNADGRTAGNERVTRRRAYDVEGSFSNFVRTVLGLGLAALPVGTWETKGAARSHSLPSSWDLNPDIVAVGAAS